jgi:PAS domain S-box-containing protein
MAHHWNKERYQQLLYTAIDYVYSVAIENGEVVSSEHSPGCVDVTGYTPAEYLADPDLWYKMVHPDDRQQLLGRLEALSTGHDVAPIEHRIYDSSGNMRWLKNVVVPAYDDQHNLVSYDGLVTDITARKQAEMLAIRSERLAALGRMSAALAHEMNNPLQAIQANLDLIIDFPLSENERRASLKKVRTEIDRLRHISGRMLSYARPQPVARRKVFIKDVVKQVLNLTGQQLAQHNIHVSTDFRPSPLVLAAPAQLLQVFLNMVINAVEASATQLHISVAGGNGRVITSFSNDGPHIPPEMLTYMFEPFFTTKTGGSGLGLWVSHMLVQQHDGTLSVENLTDQTGVVFTIDLPAAKEMN